MKRWMAPLLALALLAVFPLAGAAANTGRYKVTAEAANVYAEGDITADKLCEVYAGTVLEVTHIQRGFGQVEVRSAGVQGWVQLSNLEYLETPSSGNITGITVTPPDKTSYIQETESLDLTGLKVYAVYEDGMRVTVTGYEVFADAMDTLGDKEIRVTYTPKAGGPTFTASCKVTVVRYPVTKMTLITRPERTMYLEHEPLDLSGMVVKLTYSDGRPEQMTACEDILTDPHYTVGGCCNEAQGKPLEKGTHTVTVSYRYPDVAVSFQVSVTPRTLTNLTVVKEPDSLVTHSRDKDPNISGLVLKAEYDNGEVEEVQSGDCEVVCDPSKFILGKDNPVEVRYGGKSVTLYYKLSLNDVVGIVAVPPQNTSFLAGQAVDLSGLQVRLMYADGTYEVLTDYEMSEVDTEREGSQNIIVRYGEYSDVFTISITANYRMGDVDGNGKIQPEDARLTLRAAVGFIRFTGLAFAAADADKDGKITPEDARLILRASVGLEQL